MSSTQPLVSTPETINNVVALFIQALNHVDSVRKPAADQLAVLEITPGYCSLLCEVIRERERFPTETRLMAVIALKNVVHQYWRPRAPNAVGEQERLYLRVKLLNLLEEREEQIAVQLAILIAKIARIDFPQQWPDLLDKLLQGIREGGDLVKPRSILTLQHVTSVLCSRRLIGNRHQFQQFAPTIFLCVFEVYNQFTEAMLTQFYQYASNPNKEALSQHLVACAGMSALCLKVLRRTLEHGIPSFHQSKEVISFLSSVLERAKLLDDFRNTGQISGPLLDAVDKVIILLQKLLIHVQQAQPIPFATFLLAALQYFHRVIQTPLSNRPPPIIPAQVNALLFMKNVITNDAYAPDREKGTPRSSNALSSTASSLLTPFGEASRIVSEFFTDQYVKELTQILISQYFVLTSSELKDWNDSPEEFIRELEADAWKISRKPCAENLFLTILQQYEQPATVLVVEFLQHALKEPATTDQAIILKEAVYNAVGLGQYQFGLTINSNDLYNNIFIPDLQNPDARFKILRRRIAWVLGNWVSNIKDETRGAIYRTLVQLMMDADLAIALTSAEALKSMVDDVHFNVEQFREFVDPTITALFRILSACEDSDTQLRVLSVVAIVVEQIGEHMKHHANAIVQSLSVLWTVSSTNQLNMLKSSIVRTLTKLVHAIGSDPAAQAVHATILPVVNYSSDFNSPDSAYLLEDGLLLWLAVVQHANTASPALFSLFPHISVTLDNTLEQLETCMKIVETYLLLGTTEFMKLHAPSVANILLKLIGAVSDDGNTIVMRTLETLLTLFPNEAPPLLEGVLVKILTLALSNNETDVALTYYFSIFARIALQNLPYFLAFFNGLIQSPQNSLGPALLPTFLGKWMDKIDNMGQPRMRKLSGLGFSSLLVATGPRAGDIMQNLPMIISSMIGIIPDTDAPPEDYYELGYFENESSSSGSAAERQVHAMMKNDPVTTLSMRNFLMQKINEGIQVHGPPFQASLNSIDPVILKGLSL